jgi:hypothetical protein
LNYPFMSTINRGLVRFFRIKKSTAGSST